VLFHYHPVNLPAQPVQRMALIQYLFQPHPEKIITTTAFLLLWLHTIHQKSGGNSLDSGKFRIL
jgi:hypothetical protein